MGGRDLLAVRDPFLIKDIRGGPCRKLYTFKNKYRLYMRENIVKSLIYNAKCYIHIAK